MLSQKFLLPRESPGGPTVVSSKAPENVIANFLADV
jgi:hypothetical protein